MEQSPYEKLIVAQPVKNFSGSMEPEGPLSVNKILPFIPTLSHIIPVNILIPYF
jgi:hypothetical protein